MDLIPGLGRVPGEGNGNALQCSCLGNPMDRGAWQTTVHGVAKRQIWLRGQNHKNQESINDCENSQHDFKCAKDLSRHLAKKDIWKANTDYKML